MPEKRDDVVPVFVRRVNLNHEVFAVVLSISSFEFGAVVQIPTLPFACHVMMSDKAVPLPSLSARSRRDVAFIAPE
jgi:hypothetical protein